MVINTVVINDVLNYIDYSGYTTQAGYSERSVKLYPVPKFVLYLKNVFLFFPCLYSCIIMVYSWSMINVYNGNLLLRRW